MLEERIKVYQQFKHKKNILYGYKYKTEKDFKQLFPFLREIDSKALQSEWNHLKSAYDNFFRALKTGTRIGFPHFKSRKSKQSYTTYNINNNCKIDFQKRKLKLPKINVWINYRDDRVFEEKIQRITITKSKSGKFFASILIKIEINTRPKCEIKNKRIIGFDMSASRFLITKELSLSNPRFYRSEESKLKNFHNVLSRKQNGSSNQNRARLKLAKLYEKIKNRKKDWLNKITHVLSEHFDCIILENLNIKGMQQFNSGISKSVSLDFSWNQFINMLRYKMEQKGKNVILISRFFPSSKLCSNCEYKNEDLHLNTREWTCKQCNLHHGRDVNASNNIRNEGIRILQEQNVTIVNENTVAVGTTVKAFGEDLRLTLGQHFSMNYESSVFKQ